MNRLNHFQGAETTLCFAELEQPVNNSRAQPPPRSTYFRVETNQRQCCRVHQSLDSFTAVMHSSSSVQHGLCEPMATALSLNYQIVDPRSGIPGSGIFKVSSFDNIVRDSPAALVTINGEGHFIPDRMSSVSCGVYWHPRDGSSAIYIGSSTLTSAIEGGATWGRLIATGGFEIDDSLYGTFFSPDSFTTLHPQAFGGRIVFSPGVADRSEPAPALATTL